MAIDPLSIGVAAGVSALSPVVAKGIGSLFGLDEPSEEERQAEQLRQQALDRLTAQAEGRTASPAQLAAIAQQQRTQQALQSLAQRGSVQQRAGNLRTAMQAAPEVMAQQGAIAAQTRAQEMESARNALAQMQMASAAQQAASGRQNREYMQRIVGAGVSGAGAIAGQGMLMGAEDAAKKTAETAKPAIETATTSQAQTASRPYNEGAVNPLTGQAQYNVPKPAAGAGLVPMTDASREAASLARPSAPMGPEINIGASNQFTLSPELVPSTGAEGGYKAPSLGLGPKAPLAPSLKIGGKQRRGLYGYDPLAFQSPMKLGGGY